MPKVLTDEEKKAWGEKMKRLREEKKAKQEPEAAKPATNPKPLADRVLDLTKEKNFNTEAEFVRWIHWEYDEGNTPDVIKITSHQALIIANFTKTAPVKGYNSPFGSHRIEIVPGKNLEAKSVEEEK